GLVVYGVGALVATFAPGVGLLVLGYSLLEGVGSALMIPPIYILVTVYTTDMASRAKGLGAISAAAGIGAATGPLVGGLITSALSWRASFLLQVLVVAGIFVMTRRIPDVRPEGARPGFDLTGAALTAAGLFCVISVYLQTEQHHNAVETGLILTPATAGILLASGFAGRLARRRTHRFLIRGGFIGALAGTALLLLAGPTSSFVAMVPGLLLMGIGIGVMLTASANVVQSAFPDEEQGEISGLSRSASNLGSSLGTAIVGSVLVASVSGH